MNAPTQTRLLEETKTAAIEEENRDWVPYGFEWKDEHLRYSKWVIDGLPYATEEQRMRAMARLAWLDAENNPDNGMEGIE